MLRVGKLTDYGTVVMTHLARTPERLYSANELAAELGLALPTVSKLLKTLSNAGLLQSHRGAKGGYSLSRRPDEITVAQIVAAIEGPISLTECSHGEGLCHQETACTIRSNWQRINIAVHDALERVSLAELARPAASTFPLKFTSRDALRSTAG